MNRTPARVPLGVPDAATGPDSVDGLRATIDLAPIGLAQFDLDGRFLHVNDRLCEILGCTRPDLLPRTFQEITAADDLPRCLELTRSLAAAEIADYCLEKRFVRPDSSVMWARITVSAVRRTNGTVAFFIGAAEEITEQVTTLQNLRTAEERLRTALDASMIGTFRFDIRQNALDWADGLDRLFGGVENVTLEQFFSVIHPDDREHMMASYRKSVSDGADFEEEFRVIWPDGSIHWLHDRGRTFIGEDLQPLYILGAITDITNHKRMEEVIAAREAQFRTLANTIPQLAWVADNDGRRSWFNDRWFEYTGTTLEQSKGFGWMRAYESEAAAHAALDGMRTAFRQGAIWESTIRLRRSDGTFGWFLSRALPVRGPDGAITQWFGTNTDITDRANAEREREAVIERERMARLEAERATAVRDQVLSFVAHDLRNPLQAIMLTASGLLDQASPAAKDTRPAEIIKRCARDMDRLIADLLDVSRIESGTLAVRREPVAIPLLVSVVVERLQKQAHSRKVQLVQKVDPDLALVQGDSQRLVQAFCNLVGNAIKFTPPGGRVVIGGTQSATHVDLSVQDTGGGIAPEHIDSIFKQFWQGNRTSGGAGLGLTIVKGIVESHGGEVRVESVLNSGTTFNVRLPRASESPLFPRAPA
jgi:PAS domain S-box-containing protein